MRASALIRSVLLKLHHEVLGQRESMPSAAPPLLVLHGMLGSLANWRSVGRALADLRTVVLADLRSHGRSPHSGELSLAAMADDIAELLDALGFADADLLGHSLGGKVAMRLALDRSERVRSLIAVDIAPRATSSGADAPLHAALALDLHAYSTREQAVAALAARLGSEEIARWLAMNLQRGSDGSLSWRIPLDLLQQGRPDLAAAVEGESTFEGPVLFLRSATSGFVTDADGPRIRALFPRARIETIDGAGHWLHWEAFDQVVARVREFLA